MGENELPEGWCWTRFKDIVSHVIGGDWGKDIDSILDEDFQRVLCIRGGEIKNWQNDKGKTASLRAIKFSSLKSRQLIEGDILLEISGGGPDQPVGRTVFIDEIVLGFEPDIPKVCTNFLRLIRISNELNKKFINYYLQYLYISGEVVKYQGGSNNLRNLKYKDYELIKIPIPPLAEQNRIVEKLDVIFDKVKYIQDSWLKILSLKNKLEQRYLLDPMTHDFYKTVELSKYLLERTERIGTNWHNKPKIGVSSKDGIIDLNIGQKASFENYKIVQPGDFIYNTMRINIGSIAQYIGEDIAITSPDYVVFRIKENLSAKLLLSFLKSPNGLMEINSLTKGSVRSRLYFKNLIKIYYPLAPIEVQSEAERILGWFISTKSSLESTLDYSCSELSKKALSKAFDGSLVKQIPKYEDQES